MTELNKTYHAKDIEDAIYRKWEASGFFNPDKLEEAGDRFWKAEPFSIAMPPANITAELHLGSAMFLTIEDVMIRHARMSGKKTLWLPGTDHAAIATNYVVEREIWEKEKKTRHDLGREEFLRRVEEFIGQTRGRIQQQIRAMGASCDWSREKYTLSPELSLAVRTMFKKLYDAGLIYRGERLVNWCPHDATTLADDEVEYRELPGKLYYLRYPLKTGKTQVVVATTRPETMLGDTAVAVHPQDSRYKKFIGQSVMLPLLNRELPVLADPEVDREFGTGALKVTPGHDPHDFEIGKRNNLEVINLFTAAGKIDEQEAYDHGFEDYANLTPEQAREKIVQALADGGFLEKTEDIRHKVGVCYRCENVVEPLVSKQWFVDVNKKIHFANPEFPKLLKLKSEASLKEMSLAAVKSGAIKIIPERFGKVYLNWMENLRDWNISRQIWFGHRIPVWYCQDPSAWEDAKKMGFAPEVVPQVANGKTSTYRLRDHGFAKGDRVALANSETEQVFGWGTITEIERKPVKKIDLQDPAHAATYEKPEELIAALQKRYPTTKVDKNTEVLIYHYTFEPASAQHVACGELTVAVDAPAQCPNCGNPNLLQDPDTLDTWFSSSLWTFSTLDWPQETTDLLTYHPTTVLETGYDILFFWVARMILMTGFAVENIPFKTVYLHGLVRDRQGKKMSKSKGNAVNPLDMIEKYGTDALRLSLILGSAPGNDSKISEEKIKPYRNFVNKLWNISRFILGGADAPDLPAAAPAAASRADHWILAELETLVANTEKYLQNYQYALAGETLLDFTWNKFADWYLEIAKIETTKQPLLRYVLGQLLKLWHPFIPFVTEHLWSQLAPNLLLVEMFPKAGEKRPAAPEQAKQFQMLQELVTGLRNLRAEYRQPAAELLAAYLEPTAALDWVREEAPILDGLAFCKSNFAAVPADKKMPYFLWQGVKVYLIIPKFDPKKEKALTEKELKQTRQKAEKLREQLAKPAFLKKAPAEIVAKLQASAAEIQALTEKLKIKLKQLK